jgi:hypothetical protein
MLRGLEQCKLTAAFDLEQMSAITKELLHEDIDQIINRAALGEFHRWVVVDGQTMLVFWTGCATPTVEQGTGGRVRDTTTLVHRCEVCGSQMSHDRYGHYDCTMARTKRHLSFDEWFDQVRELVGLTLSPVARDLVESSCLDLARQLYDKSWTSVQAGRWLMSTQVLEQGDKHAS